MEKDRPKFKSVALLVLVLGFTFLSLRWISGDRRNVSESFDSFAQCLSDKGAVMYGAEWCPHCQNEKKAFGNAFRFVSYIECPDDPKRCMAAGIAGFPTWIFPNGKQLKGEQGLKRLSEESGCPLPNLER